MWSLPYFRAMMVTGTDSRKEQPMATSLYDLTLRPQRADLPADGHGRGRLPRPRGRALRTDGRRPRRLRGGAPVRRHGAVPLPDRSRLAPRRVGRGGPEDRCVHPARPGRAGPLRRAAGDHRRGPGGAGGVRSRRDRRLRGEGARSPDRPAAARLHGGDLHPLVLAAQLPFPRSHRLRHPALARRAHRQARLRGPAADQGGLGQGERAASRPSAFLDAFMDALHLDRGVVLVVRDWGSALGFDWASRHSDRVRAIVYMEAIVGTLRWDEYQPERRALFQRLRSPEGERLVLDENAFVERVLPSGVLRKLTTEELEPGRLLTGRLRAACRRWPNQVEVTVPGLHFLQEDSPMEIARAIGEFIETSPVAADRPL